MRIAIRKIFNGEKFPNYGNILHIHWTASAECSSPSPSCVGNGDGDRAEHDLRLRLTHQLPSLLVCGYQHKHAHTKPAQWAQAHGTNFTAHITAGVSMVT